MKIPTLIGIALIIALIGSMGYWFINRKSEKSSSSINISVSDLEVVNLSDTTATVVWQTNLPSIGEVIYSDNSSSLNQKALDNRDLLHPPSPRLTHFVTIKNLKPGMVYFYKVLNNSTPYPDNPQEFKTANLENIDELNFSFIKPLKGTILNSSLNPIDESLIFLEIPGGQRLATFSSTAGNFILPLKEVFTEDLSAILNISPDTPATVTVKKGNLASNVKIVISSSSVNLPPVTMGSNLDLTNFTPSPLTPIIISEANKPNFDFNNDGKLNSLDLAILRGKAGSRTLLKEDEINKFDINSDNLVNQQDVNIFSRSLTSN